jgi:uncharacterized protein (TIGR03437 family)
VWDSDDLVGSALPTDIDSVSVTVNDTYAYVEYVSPTQLNVLMPVGLASGQATLQTYNFGLASAAVTVQVQEVAPASSCKAMGSILWRRTMATGSALRIPQRRRAN